jgi:hypothetical protein
LLVLNVVDIVGKTNQPQWQELVKELRREKGLLDVVVAPADVALWGRFLAQLRAISLPLEFMVDGAPALMPDDVKEIFGFRPECSPLLKVQLESGFCLRCHFSDEEEIELDLAPRELNKRRFLGLQDFMAQVGSSLERDVLLTHENWREAVVLRYLWREAVWSG